jgi:hypothetical protein
MPTHTVRSAEVLYKGKKVGMGTGGTLELSANGEDQVTADGWVGVSKAPGTSKLTLNAIDPVQGTGITALADFMLRKTVRNTVALIDGKIVELTMVCTNIRYEWDNARGTKTAVYDFSGGDPDLTG